MTPFLEPTAIEIDWQAAYAFWAWADDRLGLFHMYAAIAALAFGPLIFFRTKGDLAHRLLGLAYILAMFATNTTALLLYDFTGGVNFFHIAAVVSLATAVAGLGFIVLYAYNKAPSVLDAHIDLMCWSYFGLVLAALAESYTRGLGPQMDSYRTFWMLFAVFMAVAGGLGAVLTVMLIKSVKRRWAPALGQTAPD